MFFWTCHLRKNSTENTELKSANQKRKKVSVILLLTMATVSGLRPAHFVRSQCPVIERIPNAFSFVALRKRSVSASAIYANDNREYVIVGGGNAAGYAARTFVEHGAAQGRLCIVSKESVAPYERPALTKGYLFPADKNPVRLPGFHTCVGSGGERQNSAWYEKHGIEVLYQDPVTNIHIDKQTLTTRSGKCLKYGSLIVATGCSPLRLPEQMGGSLLGVHYIRDVADADLLVSSLAKARKVVVVGGGYIGMEVAAACAGWGLDTTMIFPENHVMSKLFTPALAEKYEEFYMNNGVKLLKGTRVHKLHGGSDEHVAAVMLENGSYLETDLVVVGIGARPSVSPFESLELNPAIGGIQVDSLFRTSVPGIFAVGDVAAFPLKLYNRIARVEHVDHARKSAQHCVAALLSAQTRPYEYLPFFYSRVFEYEGSRRRIWWQFYGDNVGEAVVVGNFDPRVAAFWFDSGRIKGIFLESGSPEEIALLPEIAQSQPVVDKWVIQESLSVESALEIISSSMKAELSL